ncbi:regulatory component Sin3 of histone regulatory component [Hamiltosporidium tvaerminnensis]|uniref:Regulatory component Sin3 of histone regulatory component n=1 Tax=Hamiltosporidium tvaerminnensis TaxID=1176355 RepID=A0A4Q9L6N2_9MICR|nr:regulatory component Sin3 of histone regulatory component [Hamiltosporidium tvaerminnensis]
MVKDQEKERSTHTPDYTEKKRIYPEPSPSRYSGIPGNVMIRPGPPPVKFVPRMSKPPKTEEPDLNDALMYLTQVKEEFKGDNSSYDEFLEVMRDYKQSKLDAAGVVSAVSSLFRERKHLIQGFNDFLPKNYRIDLEAPPHRIPLPPKPYYDSYKRPIPPFARPPFKPQEDDPHKQRMAFDYIKKVKRRLEATPEIYSNFIQTLNSYRNTQEPTHQIVTRIKKILWDHPDLIDEFIEFLPSHPHPPPPHGKDRERQESFERIKLIMKEKGIYSEFLKCLNLYNQDLIQGKDLLFLVRPLIRQENLIDSFKEYLNYKETDIPPSTFKNLSTYNKIGSYRILPDKYRTVQKHEVLNTICVGCPTFSSEDSNFVTHKKNINQEALFRVEDERYEAEMIIQRCYSLITALEGLFMKITDDLGLKTNILEKKMEENENQDEEEKVENNEDEENMENTNLDISIEIDEIDMPPALILEVLNRIYGDKSPEILEGLLYRPFVSIPVVLKRLYLLSKNWKRQIRERNKLWREIVVKNFYKALDVQSIDFKANEKKVLSERIFLRTLREEGFTSKIVEKTVLNDLKELLGVLINNLEDNEDEINSFFKELIEKLGNDGHFYGNGTLCVIIRLLLLFGERIYEVGSICMKYEEIIHLVKDFLSQIIDYGVFEDKMRIITGCKGYKLITADKVLNKILRLGISMLKDEEGREVVKGLGVEIKGIEDVVEEINEESGNIVESISVEENINQTNESVSENNEESIEESEEGGIENNEENTEIPSNLRGDVYKVLIKGNQISMVKTASEVNDFKKYIESFIKLEVNEDFVRNNVFVSVDSKRKMSDSYINYGIKCKVGEGYKLHFVEETEDFLMKKGVKRGKSVE